MELCFEPIQKEINNIIESYPYAINYYQNIANELNCKISDLAILKMFIPEDISFEKYDIKWFFNQPHNIGKIKEIIIEKEIYSTKEFETIIFGLQTNILIVIDNDNNKQKFIAELHEEKLDTKIYCSTKDTKIPIQYKSNLILSCNKCGYKEKVIVNTDDLYHAIYDIEKKFYRDYFPYLKLYQLEMIISNTCDNCWNKIFKDE